MIELYNCNLLHDSDNIYHSGSIQPELAIKTHYESLDIAESNRVHYLCFSLPQTIPGKEMDVGLHEELKHEAGLS